MNSLVPNTLVVHSKHPFLSFCGFVGDQVFTHTHFCFPSDSSSPRICAVGYSRYPFLSLAGSGAVSKAGSSGFHTHRWFPNNSIRSQCKQLAIRGIRSFHVLDRLRFQEFVRLSHPLMVFKRILFAPQYMRLAI